MSPRSARPPGSSGNPSGPSVVIFRDQLLYPSETFITEQAASLRRYRPVFAASRRISQLPVPGPEVLLNDGGRLGRLREVVAKLHGFSPHFVSRLRRHHPALIHAHFGVDGLLALPFARALGVPLAVTFHGYDATVTGKNGGVLNYPHRKYLRHRRRLAERGDLFIAVSRHVRGLLMDQGFPAERVVVHYVGVDTERYRPREDARRDASVLFVGRLVGNKGCDHLIRAMSRVQEQHPDVELVIIGDGPEREELERLAFATLRRYRFMGVQPPDSVAEWMRRARVFAVPSVTVASGASEGFGIVFLEAQASGTPVVSFRTGGIPEAVDDGCTGLLAAPGDVAGLAAALDQLLGDPAQWEAFSRAGRERVVRDFDVHRQTAILETLYDRVASAPQR